MKILKFPDFITVEAEEKDASDAKVRIENNGGKLQVFLRAEKCRPRFIRLVWKTATEPDARIYGDAWERTYADSQWLGLNPERVMPWYFLCRENERVTAVGIMVQPASFVSWTVSGDEVTATLDVRCGGCGVELDGRELLAAEIISREYTGSAFAAACDFCEVLCPAPLLPEKPVYGGNNWYYAYGKSSREDILHDAEYQAVLTEGLENRPFMVMDDGWQLDYGTGPWLPRASFGDMAEIAAHMKEMEVRPGLWIRYLCDDRDSIPDDWRLPHRNINNGSHRDPLDPSRPEVLELITQNTRRVVGWGYELIKHDFTTFDSFADYGKDKSIITEDGWTFYDRHRTSAEIILNLYRTILNAAGNAMILGCNTVSHLCAGLVHLNRIGDDTSGTEWDRTYKYGVNTLAFRLPQNNRFYSIDADCVGIIPGKIDWEKNRQWLRLLSRSGSPLFVSCAKDSLTPEQFSEMREAYRHAADQKDLLEPLDWEETMTPEHWKLQNGEELVFNW